MFKRKTKERGDSVPSTTNGNAVAPGAAQLRERALAYERENRISEAVAAWTELDRLHPDPAIETHLVDLRCDPRNFDASTVPTEPWPRQLADPFPDVVGALPEIHAGALTMEILGGAILHHGSLLVRGLLQRDQAVALCETVDHAFAERDRHQQGAPITETAPWFVPNAQWDKQNAKHAQAMRRFNDINAAVNVADSPRALLQVVGALAQTNVAKVISEYLGEPPLLSVQKTMLRRVPPAAVPAFHQDGSFMGPRTRAVDTWVALTECGEGTDAPGLAILPRRLDACVRQQTSGPVMPLKADEVAAAGDGVEPVSPVCEPGDALMFDELLLHANGGGRSPFTRNRYALEAWFFASSSAPPSYLPILL
jgi:hypothetical protein